MSFAFFCILVVDASALREIGSLFFKKRMVTFQLHLRKKWPPFQVRRCLLSSRRSLDAAVGLALLRILGLSAACMNPYPFLQ